MLMELAPRLKWIFAAACKAKNAISWEEIDDDVDHWLDLRRRVITQLPSKRSWLLTMRPDTPLLVLLSPIMTKFRISQLSPDQMVLEV
jgi:hypothetical protein